MLVLLILIALRLKWGGFFLSFKLMFTIAFKKTLLFFLPYTSFLILQPFLPPPSYFLFFLGTASKFSSLTAAATTAWVLLCKVSDDKVGGRRKKKGENKGTRTSGDFQISMGISNTLTALLTSYLFSNPTWKHLFCFLTAFPLSFVSYCFLRSKKNTVRHA